MRHVLLCLAVLLLAGEWSPVHGQTSATDTKSYPGMPAPYTVASKSITLRDAERGKDLPLRVTFPQLPAQTDASPLPVIVFSHGMFGSKDGYQPLAEYWASYGYIVLQPTHEDSLSQGKTKFGDFSAAKFWRTRPLDVQLVLDSLDDIAKAVPAAPRMDFKRIGMGGHSFGAHTTQLVGGTTPRQLRGDHEVFSDERLQCFLAISPQGAGPALSPQSFAAMRSPTFFITGTKDSNPITGQPYTWRLTAFKEASPGDKSLLIVEDAHHNFGGISGARFAGAGPENKQQVGIVQATSLAFFDAHLRQNEKAQAFLTPDSIAKTYPDTATLEQK